MQRTFTRTLTALLLSNTLFGLPVSAQVYRCMDASGHTTYTQQPCPGGTDTGIPTDGYSRPDPRRVEQDRRHHQEILRTRQERTRPEPAPSREVSPDYASRETLASRCGRLFDGVNATHRPGLERTLARLQGTGEVIELSRRERQSLRELQCRVDRLRAADGLSPLYSR